MPPKLGSPSPATLDIAGVLGASDQTSVQVLSLYIPNKDQDGLAIRGQRRWVREAASILAVMGGGVTILPPVDGGWMNTSGTIIWEKPVIVYSYVKPDAFVANLPRLREFLHRLGRDTRQGEIAVEFDGRLFRITKFDQPHSGA